VLDLYVQSLKRYFYLRSCLKIVYYVRIDTLADQVTLYMRSMLIKFSKLLRSVANK
jgi:hypothetical protein